MFGKSYPYLSLAAGLKILNIFKASQAFAFPPEMLIRGKVTIIKLINMQ